MNSKNKPAMTVNEREHVERLKAMQWCACCRLPTDPEIHEIRQGDWFSAMPLCTDCHRGSHNGWHGRRGMWNLHKIDELGALSRTVRRLMTT